MVSGSGSVTSSEKYYPFGATRSGATVATDKAFTGHQREDADLYFMKARFYDPLVGRFLQPDNVTPGFSNPQALNRYGYVLNNPLGFTGPTGHESECADVSGTRVCSLPTFENSCGPDCEDSILSIFDQSPIAIGLIGTGATLSPPVAFALVSVLLLGAVIHYDCTHPTDVCKDLILAGLARLGQALAGTGGAFKSVALDLTDRGADVGRTIGRHIPGLSTVFSSDEHERLEETPKTDPKQFVPVRGTDAKQHKGTGEIWAPDHLHGDEYEVYKKKKMFEKGQRDRSVREDGRVKEYIR